MDWLALYAAFVGTGGLALSAWTWWADRRISVKIADPRIIDDGPVAFVSDTASYDRDPDFEAVVIDVVNHSSVAVAVKRVAGEYVTVAAAARFEEMRRSDGEEVLEPYQHAEYRLSLARDGERSWPVRFHVHLVTGEHFTTSEWTPPESRADGRSKLRTKRTRT